MKKSTIGFLILFSAIFFTLSWACTGVQLKTNMVLFLLGESHTMNCQGVRDCLFFPHDPIFINEQFFKGLNHENFISNHCY